MYNPIKIGEFLRRKKVPIRLNPEEEYTLITVKLHHKGVVQREKKKGSLIGSNMYKVSEGDFILSGIDARNGAFGIVPCELDGAIVTNDFWYFSIDESKVKRDFFFWLTTTPLFLDACQKSSKGETQRIRLQKDLFYDFEFHFPSVEKQDDFLSSFQTSEKCLSELSNESDYQTDLLTKLRQSILQEAIEGKLTTKWRKDNPVKRGDPDYDADALLTRIKSEKQKLIAEGKIKKERPLPAIMQDDVPFDLPAGWAVTRLGVVASVVRGGSPRPAGSKQYYDGNIPFLKVADLTASDSVYLDSFTYTIKEAGLFKTRQVDKDTLMLTNSGATLGIPKICTFKTTFNDGIAAFLGMLPELDLEFFYYFLKAKSGWFLNEAARGQGQPNLNTDIIGNTVIYLPPIREQFAIVACVKRIQSIVEELEIQVKEQREKSQELLQSVLREVFRGNVND